MTTTIDLSNEEAAELQSLTNQNDPSSAVREAMLSFLQHARRMRLKALSGRVTMLDNWAELEQQELRTSHDKNQFGAAPTT